ncbi:hypothetical protein LOD99_3998 [Oopsacas minuta]|uniref:ATP-dependent DNA helicase n=1 Tax=Oopsacas minuta TaxID=111878 RepID=A0AAV7JW84_9METZ|nr:hypothetical protein LOD99_3998 [Oopsacas minuta]
MYQHIWSIVSYGRDISEVPIRLNELSVCNIPKQIKLAKLIQSANLLVLDEAPMAHRYAAECIDRSLRDICSCELPYGGKVIVIRRDFRQILPEFDIVPEDSEVDYKLAAPKFRPTGLSRSKQFLRGTEPVNESNMIHLDAKYVVCGETIGDLAANIIGDIKEKYNDRDYITSHIMMSPKTKQLNTSAIML